MSRGWFLHAFDAVCRGEGDSGGEAVCRGEGDSGGEAEGGKEREDGWKE